MIEVEIKFRVPDEAFLSEWIKRTGLSFGEPTRQKDVYFNHPQRNFRETDEALRIRISGEENALTYKGPRVDTLTRTRPETEIPFQSGSATAAQMESILLALGFRIIESVQKFRRTAQLDLDGLEIEVTLDDVTELGPFIEIETIACNDDWEPARNRIVQLAEEWGLLPHREPRSYLRMLLEQQGVLPPASPC